MADKWKELENFNGDGDGDGDSKDNNLSKKISDEGAKIAEILPKQVNVILERMALISTVVEAMKEYGMESVFKELDNGLKIGGGKSSAEKRVFRKVSLKGYKSLIKEFEHLGEIRGILSYLVRAKTQDQDKGKEK